ncbi:hypothetical protein BH23ACT4_BH23ACT4_00520 [soil metagenome]
MALFAGCGSADGESLDSLQLVGVDFELDSIILSNGGGDNLLTDDVWVYQDGNAFELGLFTIEPRATILFRVREFDGVDPSGGEIALFSSDSFADQDAVLDYVAWGSSGHGLIEDGVIAGTWSEIGPIEVPSDATALIRFDSQFFGPDGWEPYTDDE